MIYGPPKIKENGIIYYPCLCDCGVIKEVRVYSLIDGKSRSCGCLSKEITAKRELIHGNSAKPEYLIWIKIKHRCNNPKDRQYPNYGGRGILLCKKWLDFEEFSKDMGPRPGPKHTIDRINNNGNYEPGNCRWATKKEQNNNKRNNVLVEIGSEIKTIAGWAAASGLRHSTILERHKRGWVGFDLIKPVNSPK